MDALDAAMTTYGGDTSADTLDAAMTSFANSKPVRELKPLPRRDPGLLPIIGNGLVKGVAGFGDMVGNTLVNAANLGIAGYGVAKHALTGSSDLPDLIPSDALAGYAKLADAAGLTSPDREPTTPGGRVADFAAQVVGGGGVNPRALVSAAARGKIVNPALQLATPVIGGSAGGAVAELTDQSADPDTWYGRLARATLPALAQMGASVPTARRSPAGSRAAQTTNTLSAADWQAAGALAKQAAAMGAPITAAEAIQRVAGNNPGLQSLQRVTEQSGPGVNSLAPAFAQRPAQNASLVGGLADQIYANERAPEAIAGTLQKSAQGAIDTARAAGNAQAAPFYAASSNNPAMKVPAHAWNTLVSDPAVAWALRQTQKDPLLGVQGAQPGSLQWLDAAKKYLDSHSNKEGLAGNNFPASQASKAATLITSTVDPLVPDYAKARAIVARNISNVVEPMQAGQIGKLAGSDNFVSQLGTLLPEKPMDVTPGTIGRTASLIGAQDPNILPRSLAQYVRGTFNESNQDLQGGANQWGGAKFAARIAGNDVQGANLQALLDAAVPRNVPISDALDVLRAQGTRPQPGSATTFNNGETGLLSGGLLSAIGKPLQLPGLLAEKLAYSTSTRDLAKALYPDAGTVGRFQDLARANGSYSPMKQAAVAGLLTASKGGNAPLTYENYLREFDAATTKDEKIALGKKYAAVLGGLLASETANQ